LTTLENNKGFTLVELLIIVMIMGILAMAGVPSITSFLADSKLSSASTIMVSAIETTVSLSIRYQRPFQINADVSTNSFEIIDTAPYPDDTKGTIRLNNLPPVNGDDIVFNTLSGSWYQVDLDTIGNFEGVSIDSGPAELKFYPDGHSTYTDKKYILSLGERSDTININGISGRIFVD
jgi:prepilin-type N-terminal cleavage/methylation domain-containing protein